MIDANIGKNVTWLLSKLLSLPDVLSETEPLGLGWEVLVATTFFLSGNLTHKFLTARAQESGA